MGKLVKELMTASLRGVKAEHMGLYSVVCGVCFILGIVILAKGEDPSAGYVVMIMSSVMFIYLLMAKRYVLDSKKMNLQFRLPTSEEKLFVNKQIQKIANAYEKENIPVVCYFTYIGVTILMMILCKGMIGTAGIGALLASVFLPGVFAMVVAYVLFHGVTKSKLEMIERGEYCLAEAVVENKYTIRTSTRYGRTRTRYFAAFSDSAGVQGEFVLPPHVFDMLYEGDTIHLLEWNRGKGFYNHMEPITILNSIDRLGY